MSTAERAPGRRPPAADLLTIGEVLGSLREDFPDVTPSKVRFLEERGLVTPARTPSGYRKFAPAHVARLRLVLSLQRDHYLPLRVIGEHLADLDAGQDPPLPAAGVPGDSVVHRSVVDRPGPTDRPGSPEPPAAVPEHIDLTRQPAPQPLEGPAPTPTSTQTERALPASGARSVLTFDALVEVAGGDAALVDALDAHGLLPRPLDSGDAAAAARVVRAALALGGHGIEPRHLRVLRTAAEREAALVEQVAAPLRRVRAGDDVDGRAETVTAHLRETLGDLRSALLVAQLPPATR